LLNLEISLSVLAAFFTIVGYSLNDTIVVFDRIRENLKLKRRDSFFTVLNISITQSLSRTVITSLTTLVVVLHREATHLPWMAVPGKVATTNGLFTKQNPGRFSQAWPRFDNPGRAS
jgi:hypothetical protein